MDLHHLTKTDGPWLHSVIAAHADLSNQVRALEQESTRRLVVRVVRGRKATTKASLLDECAAALQFPLSFGENWDALNDCLRDLDWLNAQVFVLVIADAVQLLTEGSADEFKQFFHILEQAATNWRPNSVHSNRRPYHVVLHAVSGEQAALHTRCQAASMHADKLA